MDTRAEKFMDIGRRRRRRWAEKVDKTQLKAEMAAARTNRTEENKKIRCCQFSF
jgi:hypothetical protein